MTGPVYLDNNATTPIHPQVAAAIEPYLYGHPGNPSSSHVLGQRGGDSRRRRPGAGRRPAGLHGR